MTTIDKKKFAVAIKRYREANDLTLQELADRVPTTLNTVYRWESGKAFPKNRIILNRLREMGITF